MENNKALDQKYQEILEVLGEQATFYVEDLQNVFPDMKNPHFTGTYPNR